jgi:hypothetical protein
MRVPIRARITLLIIAGIAVGTGATVFGLLVPISDRATFIATGSTVLAGSIAALIGHLARAFDDIDDREQ